MRNSAKYLFAVILAISPVHCAAAVTKCRELVSPDKVRLLESRFRDNFEREFRLDYVDRNRQASA